MCRRRFIRVRGLSDKYGYTKWLYFEGVPHHKKNNNNNKKKSFEDRERTLVELKSFFCQTLYHWTIALDLNFFA